VRAKSAPDAQFPALDTSTAGVELVCLLRARASRGPGTRRPDIAFAMAPVLGRATSKMMFVTPVDI